MSTLQEQKEDRQSSRDQFDVKPQHSKKKSLTARELLNSDLIGMWEHRTDITDSSTYARQLRAQAETRDLDYLQQGYCNNGSLGEK